MGKREPLDDADDCPGCERAPPTGYYLCPVCDAEYPVEDDDEVDTLIPADRITELEGEVARLRADLAYERRINGREAERIFVASLLADEIEVLTNSPSSFDVQDGIALTAFQKRLIGLWRVRDSLPAPSEKEAGR